MADKQNNIAPFVIGGAGLAALAVGLFAFPLIGAIALSVLAVVGTALAMAFASGEGIEGMMSGLKNGIYKAGQGIAGLFGQEIGDQPDLSAAVSGSNGTILDEVGYGVAGGVAVKAGQKLWSLRSSSPENAYKRVMELVKELENPSSNLKPEEIQARVSELGEAKEKAQKLIDAAEKRSWKSLWLKKPKQEGLNARIDTVIDNTKRALDAQAHAAANAKVQASAAPLQQASVTPPAAGANPHGMTDVELSQARNYLLGDGNNTDLERFTPAQRAYISTVQQAADAADVQTTGARPAAEGASRGASLTPVEEFAKAGETFESEIKRIGEKGNWETRQSRDTARHSSIEKLAPTYPQANAPDVDAPSTPTKNRLATTINNRVGASVPAYASGSGGGYHTTADTPIDTDTWTPTKATSSSGADAPSAPASVRGGSGHAAHASKWGAGLNAYGLSHDAVAMYRAIEGERYQDAAAWFVSGSVNGAALTDDVAIVLQNIPENQRGKFAQAIASRIPASGGILSPHLRTLFRGAPLLGVAVDAALEENGYRGERFVGSGASTAAAYAAAEGVKTGIAAAGIKTTTGAATLGIGGAGTLAVTGPLAAAVVIGWAGYEITDSVIQQHKLLDQFNENLETKPHIKSLGIKFGADLSNPDTYDKLRNDIRSYISESEGIMSKNWGPIASALGNMANIGEWLGPTSYPDKYNNAATEKHAAESALKELDQLEKEMREHYFPEMHRLADRARQEQLAMRSDTSSLSPPPTPRSHSPANSPTPQAR